MTISAGAAHVWQGTRFSGDMPVGSGLRAALAGRASPKQAVPVRMAHHVQSRRHLRKDDAV